MPTVKTVWYSILLSASTSVFCGMSCWSLYVHMWGTGYHYYVTLLLWHVVTERSNMLDLSSAVSHQQSVGSIHFSEKQVKCCFLMHFSSSLLFCLPKSGLNVLVIHVSIFLFFWFQILIFLISRFYLFSKLTVQKWTSAIWVSWRQKCGLNILV